MTTALILTVLALAAGGFLLYRRRTPAGRGAAESKALQYSADRAEQMSAGNFRSVGIDVGVNCCQAAHRVAGERYLIKLAPKLPLPDCNVEDCNCKYIHFADRRSGDNDRRSLSRLRTRLADSAFEGGERRKLRDRRRSKA